MPEQVVKSERKDFKSTSIMKQIMADHFYELDKAAKTKSQKIAWCTSVGPAEILRAMGFLVYFPENHGAMLGATRTATDFIPVANSIGYSPEICSYLTSDIPYHGLIRESARCQDRMSWFIIPINAATCRTGLTFMPGNSRSRLWG